MAANETSGFSLQEEYVTVPKSQLQKMLEEVAEIRSRLSGRSVLPK